MFEFLFTLILGVLSTIFVVAGAGRLKDMRVARKMHAAHNPHKTSRNAALSKEIEMPEESEEDLRRIWDEIDEASRAANREKNF